MAPLAEALLEFDGRNTKLLEVIRDSYSDAEAPIDEALELCGSNDEIAQVGATWLLRAWLERDPSCEATHATKLARCLEALISHHAVLHVCQSIGALKISRGKSAETYATFLRQGLGHRRPFIRAWATDGLTRLAEQHPTYAAEAEEAVARALEDGAASVRARARNILARK